MDAIERQLSDALADATVTFVEARMADGTGQRKAQAALLAALVLATALVIAASDPAMRVALTSVTCAQLMTATERLADLREGGAGVSIQ